MTRAAAGASAAADALLEFLRRQPPPVFQRQQPPDFTPGQPEAGAPPRPDAQPPADLTRPNGAADTTPVPEPAPPPGPATARSGAPQRLAHTDWLYHHLTITGPDAALAAFRTAAEGAGSIPWQLDLERIEEDCFHLLVAPPPPHRRSLSLAGARIVAGQLRDVVARGHDLAVARVGRSRACPFDLHALVPVPAEILERGPDDPAALAWLWQHWGTTRALRHVAADAAPRPDRPGRPAAGEAVLRLSFWSADWSPWRALAAIAARWPALRFDLCPFYDPP